jgi:hypothetical protein
VHVAGTQSPTPRCGSVIAVPRPVRNKGKYMQAPPLALLSVLGRTLASRRSPGQRWMPLRSGRWKRMTGRSFGRPNRAWASICGVVEEVEVDPVRDHLHDGRDRWKQVRTEPPRDQSFVTLSHASIILSCNGHRCYECYHCSPAMAGRATQLYNPRE